MGQPLQSEMFCLFLNDDPLHGHALIGHRLDEVNAALQFRQVEAVLAVVGVDAEVLHFIAEHINYGKISIAHRLSAKINLHKAA
jgi:hypothetical protein